MARNKATIAYRMKTDPFVKKSIDAIVDQLEHHGRALAPNGSTNRIFSRFMRDNVNERKIIFGKGTVMLSPGCKLVKTKGNRIKIVYENEKGRL